MFGQSFFNTGRSWEIRGTPASLSRIRNDVFKINPNMIFLVEIRMVTDWPESVPDDSPYWLRDAEDNFLNPNVRRFVNFTDPEAQDIIVQRAVAVSKCGLYDGIFFDHWNEHRSVLTNGHLGFEGYVGFQAEQNARDIILERIRAETRPDFLIMGNTNDRIIPRTAPYINGSFMESSDPGDEMLTRYENSLRWLERNLRGPRINALEGEAIPTEPPDSPTNLRWMRAITTLHLTHSDGYVLFRSIDGHKHYWYDFWDADLGRPVGARAQLYDEDIPGLYIREYTNGWAVYNHSGETQEITLPELATGVSSEVEGMTHTLPNLDGEMYLRAVARDQSPVTSKNPADVNGVGVVNILDCTGLRDGQSGGGRERRWVCQHS